MIPTQARLHELISYNPETGELRWLQSRGRAPVGSVAGHVGSGGYCRIKIDGSVHLAHRIIWLYQTGEWPDGELDHVDRDGSNNRWANIRRATRAQNGANREVQSNNKLGLKGVFKTKQRRPKSYVAKIQVAGGQKCIGYYETAEEASAAYLTEAKKHYGEFAINGGPA